MALETQLNQLASQLQEQGATNAHMTDEIRECVVIRERLVHQENQLAHLQQTLMQVEVRCVGNTVFVDDSLKRNEHNLRE